MSKAISTEEAVAFIRSDEDRSRAFLLSYTKAEVRVEDKEVAQQSYAYLLMSGWDCLCGAQSEDISPTCNIDDLVREQRKAAVQMLQTAGILPAGLFAWIMNLALRWAIEKFLEDVLHRWTIEGLVQDWDEDPRSMGWVGSDGLP